MSDSKIQTTHRAGRYQQAVLSSQIEGTQSSLQDLLELEADLLERESGRNDIGEVVNYVGAMNLGLRRLRELPVSNRLIREIHARLLEGVRGGNLTPGELRKSQNWIGPPGSTLADATFVPPPPHVVPEALSDLERFLHQEDDIPALVKIGMAHAQFETIHPFLDGNGRVGRLLITFLLCEREIMRRPVLYLSYYFKRNRQEYYDRLQAVRDSGDWEGWLAYFLKGVAEVSAEATETSRQILAMRERDRDLITEKLGRAAANGHKVLQSLFGRPIVTVNEVQDVIGTTYQAANAIVGRLEDVGILQEITGYARNRKFSYAEYVRLFTQGTEAHE